VTDEILATAKLSRRFGGVRAVTDVSLGVAKGQLRAIIGPNGAGKTTLFNLLTGQVRCDAGRIFFKGADITGRPPHYLCRNGLARTFQINSIFLSATVFENVQLAILAHRGKTWNPLGTARRLMIRETEELLERLGLAGEADKLGGSLSYGDRRRLEVALALACQPDLLLLDEPTSGMSLSEKPALVRLIQSVVKEKGVTTVLIEHDMDVVFSVSDRITVMHQGAVLAEGTPGEIQANRRVQEVYLGDGRHA
jgi:branched-chain amino acid transport system ATP-binding protein